MDYIIKGKKLIYIDNQDNFYPIKEIEYSDIENKELIEEIIIPEGVVSIGDNAFKGFTKLKKIKLPNSLHRLGKSVFANCTSLTKITIPEGISIINDYLFQNCTKLKSVKYSEDSIKVICFKAFENCSSLKELPLSPSLETIESFAFSGCSKIKRIHIPMYVNRIEYGAFSFMDSLEEITVDEHNKKYISHNNIALINDNDGILVQYAIASNETSFDIGKYYVKCQSQFSLIDSSNMIYDVADYAFANANNLKEITIYGELDSIASHTFMGCNNLKKLIVKKSDFGKSLSVHVHDYDHDAIIPFEEIIIEDGIKEISSCMEQLFRNAKIISLPKSLQKIGADTFNTNKNIKRFNLSKNITHISLDAFSNDIIISLEEFGDINSNNFGFLITKTSENIDLLSQDKDKLKILSLKDHTYKIIYDDFDMITVSKNDIERYARHGEKIANNPEIFIRHIINLISYSLSSPEMIDRMFCNEEFKREYLSLINNIDILNSIRDKNIQSFIDNLLKSKNIYNEVLFNGLIINKCTKEEIIMIAENMSEALYKFLKIHHYFENEYSNNSLLPKLNSTNIERVINYTNLLEQKKVYNPFFYKMIFTFLDKTTMDKLIDNYNGNLKRCLSMACSLDSKTSATNLIDVIKLLTVLGAFDEDKCTSQRAVTFVTEKIIIENEICDDKFHTYFNEFNNPSFNKEFSILFIENYKELLELEKTNSGTITRIYNEFGEIRKHCTSNRGSQRQLKVTIDKCLDYFLINKFTGFEEQYRPLAEFLGKHFSEPETLNVAIQILKNAEKAPRNIFSKYKVVNDDIIYDNNPDFDIRGSINEDYSYEWLPKQDYENFVLGKYCNCCAHILGAGAGIMRFSMEDSNTQNLVVRNKDGLIIAKMTLTINRLTGTGIFNTVEISSTISTDEYEKIYNTFIEGINRFVDEYNKNNPISIKGLSIGYNRNKFIDLLIQNNLGDEVFYTPTDYSKGKYKVGEIPCGNYPGDALEKQLAIYKKQK